MALELAATVSATDNHILVTGTVPDEIGPGFQFVIDDERLRLKGFEGVLPGFPEPEDKHNWRVERGVGGSARAIHEAEAVLYASMPAVAVSEDLTPPSPVIAPGGSGLADGFGTADEYTEITGAAGASGQAGAGLIVKGGPGDGGATEGARIEFQAGQNNDGGNLNLSAGDGDGDGGSDGEINLNSDVRVNGNLSAIARDGGSGEDGGSSQLSGGHGNASEQDASLVSADGGQSDGRGGHARVRAGSGESGKAGGDAILSAGYGDAGSDAPAEIRLKAGSGGGTPGAIVLTGVIVATTDPHIANALWADSSDGYAIKLSQPA